MRRRYEQDSDISNLNESGIGREYADHALAAQEQHRDHESFDDDAFEHAELQRLFASVQLPGSVILTRESRARLTKAVEYIVREYLKVECRGGCSRNDRSEAVDR